MGVTMSSFVFTLGTVALALLQDMSTHIWTTQDMQTCITASTVSKMNARRLQKGLPMLVEFTFMKARLATMPTALAVIIMRQTMIHGQFWDTKPNMVAKLMVVSWPTLVKRRTLQAGLLSCTTALADALRVQCSPPSLKSWSDQRFFQLREGFDAWQTIF